MILKHIPNILTIARLLLIIPFLGAVTEREYQWAFYILLIAGLTDGFDGWLARQFNWQSRLGSFLDPLADKLLIASSFITLALIGELPWWLVLLVFARDVTISIGIVAWYWFIQRKLEFTPTLISKLNTALQLMLVVLCLFNLAYFRLVPTLVDILIYITAITTAISFIDYVWTWGKKAFCKTDTCR